MYTPQKPGGGHVRVLHVAQSIAGGVASFLEEVAPHQTQLYGADNVYFLIPAGSEAHLGGVDASQILTFAPISRDPRALLQFARSAQQAIAKLQPDIVHLHSTFAGAAVRARGRRKGGPRIIYCPHGWAFGMDITAAKKRIYAIIERILARRTDMVLCNSQAEYDAAVSFGIPAAKMRVVRNGIAWTPLPERKTHSQLKLGFIGRFDRQKGLEILLDAIRRFKLDRFQFEIVGDKVLASDDVDLSAPANVTFHGWQSRVKTLELLEGFDALVMPSRWDAAPIVATEAMRAGVPVIASNRGGLPEIVEHGVGGYVFDLDDPEALGRLLGSLDQADLKRLGASARERWETFYLAEQMNDLTCAAYDDVLSAAPSSKPRDFNSADTAHAITES